MIATANDVSPGIAVEFGRKIIYSKERPDGKELEEIIRIIKQGKTDPA